MLEGPGGGIAKFKKGSEHALSKLLDDNPDTFGKQGSQLRTQCSKYVTQWVGYSKAGTYTEKVLNRYLIQSAATQKKEAASTKKKGLDLGDISDDSKEEESLSSGSESGDSAEATSRAKSKSKSNNKTKKKPPKEVLVHSPPAPAPELAVKKEQKQYQFQAKTVSSVPVSPAPSFHFELKLKPKETMTGEKLLLSS